MTVFFHAHIDELEYMLRIAIAALCGGIIGFERSRMRKEAGLRTHIIVAVGAALLMIVSKYGFTDIWIRPEYGWMALVWQQMSLRGFPSLGQGLSSCAMFLLKG